ncbi:hypothetical protein E2C01_095398 [Portunus trituberculatus]|uniref:Uncharacterized protein n=1 Tax=Portunus trituberculatus TaxID=210409 RepID=A0A5B7JPQ6_PORTR|nr:hypothetical protein [Portunus trituberculatus]
MLHRLTSLGTQTNKLRCSTSPSSSLNLTMSRHSSIFNRSSWRMLKRAYRVILGPAYTNYDYPLTILSLPMLITRHLEALRRL